MKFVNGELLEKSVKFIGAPQGRVSQALRGRIGELELTDQFFLQLALEDGKTLREVAVVVGCTTGTASRRFRALMKRLRDPLVIALIERRCPLPEDYREIGLDYFLRRRKSREIAQLRKVTRFQVMQIIHFMRSWFSGLCANRDFLLCRQSV